MPKRITKISQDFDKIYDNAKTTEATFQKNRDYLNFKAQKNFKFSDVDHIITRLYERFYLGETIYWNKRVLDENLCPKEMRGMYFYNLFNKLDTAKEFELLLEYGQKAQNEGDLGTINHCALFE